MYPIPNDIELQLVNTPTAQLKGSEIVTPLAYDEFRASGEGYQAMIDASAAQRTGTSDEIAEAAAFLLGEHARFITGTDLLIDGGVIASIRTGEFKLWQ